jgi:hypothetical protein
VTNEFFSAQVQAMKERFASVTGTGTAMFEREEVIVTARPEPAEWPFTMMIVSFGLGAVVCLEERFVEWARQHQPGGRDEAFFLGYALEREARERGEALNAGPPILGWALSSKPTAPTVPDGYRLEHVDGTWMKEWQAKGLFTNALGLPEQAHRTFRNQFAAVLMDDEGEPAAIAGAYDTAGLLEIGVDVRREHRGRGVAAVTVSAVAGKILERGATPFYECAVTNIRSQRTALSCGFVPVCTTALVYQAGLGMA